MMDDLKNKKILLVGGLITIFITLFLPFYSCHVDGYWSNNYTISYPLIESWEGFVLILCIVACLLLTFNKSIIQKVKPIYIVIPIIIIILVLLYDITHINKYEEYKYGIGFYLELIGISSLIAYVFIYKGNGRIINIQSSNSNVIQPQMMNSQQMYGMQQQSMYGVMPQQPMQDIQQQPMYGMPQQSINNVQLVNDTIQETNTLEQPMNEEIKKDDNKEKVEIEKKNNTDNKDQIDNKKEKKDKDIDEKKHVDEKKEKKDKDKDK